MSWQKKRIGEYLKIKHGWAFKGEFFDSAGDYVLLTPGNAYEEGGLKHKGDKEKYYAGDFPEEFLLHKEDLLVVMTDLIQSAPILGASILIPEDNKYLHNQRLGLVIIKNENLLNRRFAYHLFNSPIYRAQVRATATGATVRHTAPMRIYDCEVYIPDEIEEQVQIASILDTYNDLIADNQRRIQLLEEAARRLHREWFVHLRFPGYEEVSGVDGISEGWQSGFAYEFLDVMSGGTPKTSIENYWNGDIPFFTPKDAPDGIYVTKTEKNITEDGLSNCNSKLYPKETVFITARGTVGKLALAQCPMAMNQSCYAIKTKENLGVNNLWMFLAVQSAVEHFKQAASEGVFRSIVVNTFKTIPFICPSPAITHQFGDLLRPLFDQVETLMLQNSRLKLARDQLLPKLMSGKLDISRIKTESPVVEAG